MSLVKNNFNSQFNTVLIEPRIRRRETGLCIKQDRCRFWDQTKEPEKTVWSAFKQKQTCSGKENAVTMALLKCYSNITQFMTLKLSFYFGVPILSLAKDC